MFLIWCGSDPQCCEGLMLKEVIMQGLLWDLYEAILWSLCSSSKGERGSKNTGGSEQHAPGYERSGGLNWTLREKRSPREPGPCFPSLACCWVPGALCLGDISYLAFRSYSPHACLTAYYKTSVRKTVARSEVFAWPAWKIQLRERWVLKDFSPVYS